MNRVSHWRSGATIHEFRDQEYVLGVGRRRIADTSTVSRAKAPMTPEERHRYLGELLAFAASLKVPDDFVIEGDIEDVGPEKEPENG